MPARCHVATQRLPASARCIAPHRWCSSRWRPARGCRRRNTAPSLCSPLPRSAAGQLPRVLSLHMPLRAHVRGTSPVLLGHIYGLRLFALSRELVCGSAGCRLRRHVAVVGVRLRLRLRLAHSALKTPHSFFPSSARSPIRFRHHQPAAPQPPRLPSHRFQRRVCFLPPFLRSHRLPSHQPRQRPLSTAVTSEAVQTTHPVTPAAPASLLARSAPSLRRRRDGAPRLKKAKRASPVVLPSPGISRPKEKIPDEDKTLWLSKWSVGAVCYCRRS